jgi:hypothetical protein
MRVALALFGGMLARSASGGWGRSIADGHSTSHRALCSRYSRTPPARAESRGPLRCYPAAVPPNGTLLDRHEYGWGHLRQWPARSMATPIIGHWRHDRERRLAQPSGQPDLRPPNRESGRLSVSRFAPHAGDHFGNALAIRHEFHAEFVNETIIVVQISA